MEYEQVVFSGHAIRRMFERSISKAEVLKETVMKCVMCKQGETQPGMVTVTLQRGETTVIIKNVSGDVCENCGEYYLSDSITERILGMAEEAVKKGVEVEILRLAA